MQVDALGVVEREDARDRIENVVGRVRRAALLEAHVIVDADACEGGKLLPSEAAHSAAAECADADRLGAYAPTPVLQELTESGALAHLFSIARRRAPE
jgi:hypothetical protein